MIIVDSDERCDYERAMRELSMERAREKLQKLKQRVTSGKLKKSEKIGAAAERIMHQYHGYRYFGWEVRRGSSTSPRTRRPSKPRSGSKENM